MVKERKRGLTLWILSADYFIVFDKAAELRFETVITYLMDAGANNRAPSPFTTDWVTGLSCCVTGLFWVFLQIFLAFLFRCTNYICNLTAFFCAHCLKTSHSAFGITCAFPYIIAIVPDAPPGSFSQHQQVHLRLHGARAAQGLPAPIGGFPWVGVPTVETSKKQTNE